MCGIAAFLFSSQIDSSCEKYTQTLRALQDIIKRRGPDWDQTLYLPSATLTSSVLALRGASVVKQPYKDEGENPDYFLFNGQIYVNAQTGEELSQEKSDTALVGDLLFKATSVKQVVEILNRFQGPYAFILVKTSLNLVFFGRDPRGRRSLLIHEPQNEQDPYILASVAVSPYSNWTPVDCQGVYSLPLKHNGQSISPERTVWLPKLKLTKQLPPPSPVNLHLVKTLADQLQNSRLVDLALGLLAVLEAAVDRRVRTIPPPSNPLLIRDGENVAKHQDNNDKSSSPPQVCDGENAAKHQDNSLTDHKPSRVAVLFSGGIDCTVLAALAHTKLPDKNEPIDLINVCFASPKHNSPDRKTALASYKELAEVYPERPWRLICANVSPSEVEACESKILSLIHPKSSHMDFNIGGALWFAARGQGIVASPPKELPDAMKDMAHLEALLAPSSESQCRHANLEPAGAASAVPVKRACETATPKPARKKVQLQSSAPPHTASASRDDAPVQATPEHIVSSAKVLLNGIGADELFAGYTRHRVSFKRGGTRGLREELDLDIARLWERNLGRDDRCIADHGRELRQPFLDESVVEFVRNIPLEDIADLTKPRGVGEKRILRIVAHLLGLEHCAQLGKRAIQFGTRIAKLSNSKASVGKVDGTNKYQSANQPS